MDRDAATRAVRDNGIDNCCAALRRLLEQLYRKNNFNGTPMIQCSMANSRIQSYKVGVLMRLEEVPG